MLSNLGLTFKVMPSNFEENLDKGDFPTPDLYVIETAKQKVLEVCERVSLNEPSLIIGSDTVVVLDGKILEKPKDKNEAFLMLSSLSGRTHDVYSGVALMHKVNGVQNMHLFYEKTGVEMGVLSRETINAYIATGEPMDKAGGYGIQGTKCSGFIKGVHGCYNNVVGFPIYHFCKELEDIIE